MELRVSPGREGACGGVEEGWTPLSVWGTDCCSVSRECLQTRFRSVEPS